MCVWGGGRRVEKTQEHGVVKNSLVQVWSSNCVLHSYVLAFAVTKNLWRGLTPRTSNNIFSESTLNKGLSYEET